RDEGGTSELAGALAARAGTLSLLAGQHEAAATAYRQSLESAPDDGEALLGALAYSVSSRDAGSRATLLERLRQLCDGEGGEMLDLQIARARLAAGDIAGAAESLTRLDDEAQSHLSALLLIGQVASAAGDREQEARVALTLAARLADPELQQALLERGGTLLEQLGRTAEAAAVLRHALALHPDDDELATRLEALYVELGDREGLEQILTHRIVYAEASADAATLSELYSRRSRLRLERDDLPGGVSDLWRVLALEPRHAEVLSRLAQIYDDEHDHGRAVDLWSRYIEAVDSPAARRAPTLRVAELLVAASRPSAAIDVCRRYVETTPDDAQVVERLAELYVEQGDYVAGVHALEKLVGLRDDVEWRARGLRRIAKLYRDRLDNKKQARVTLEAARELTPTDIELIDELRQLLKSAEALSDVHMLLERAKDDLREALGTQPLSVELFKRLMRVSAWDADQHGLLASLGVLVCLRASSEEDIALYQRRARLLSFDPKGKVEQHLFRDALQPAGARDRYGEIWSVVAPYLPKLYPDQLPHDPSTFGVSRGDRVQRHSGGPASRVIDHVADALGVGDFELYLSSQDAQIVAMLSGEKPGLVVGHQVVSTMDAAQRFRVGRAVSMLGVQASALSVLDRDELNRILGAAIFIHEPSVLFEAPRDDVEAMSRRLQKVLSRKAKKALPLAVDRFLREGGKLDRWIEGTLESANRAGLLASGDIVAAIDGLLAGATGSARPKDKSSVLAALEDSPQAQRLLLFSVSRQYLDLRARLKL
ncbi:MAG: tetratricopeptide repeat protein, partial [Myxococcales bacterium]|nr:tetratricopeptide repeat protein [Myxococcales bacterium]